MQGKWLEYPQTVIRSVEGKNRGKGGWAAEQQQLLNCSWTLKRILEKKYIHIYLITLIALAPLKFASGL